MRTFTYQDGKSSKFWNIELMGKSFEVTFGKIGAKGQAQVKAFADEAGALKEHDKLVQEKIKKGYQETTIAAAPAPKPAAKAKPPAPAPAPAPIVRTPLRAAGSRRAFVFSEGSSGKFWNIELMGKSFTVTYGKLGTKGQTQVKEFADDAKALKEHDKLVAEKVGKGYKEQAAAEAPSPLREALEKALVEAPDDVATHMAYADYLQEQGSPRGEFVRTQLALENESTGKAEREGLRAREKELLAAHQQAWLGELAPYLLGPAEAIPEDNAIEDVQPGEPNYQFRFARGWLDSLHLGDMDRTLADRLARSPQTRLLRQLTILHDSYDAPGLPRLGKSPHLGNVRRFQLGPDDDSCHVSGEEVLPLIDRMPKLEELNLCAHRVPVKTLFARALPHLRKLTVHHVHEYPLSVLGKNASLGRLEYLSCWPHGWEGDDTASYIPAKEVCAFVRSPHLKSLRHLALYLSGLGDEGVEAIVKSGLLKQLKVLDLWSGRITDAGARALAACPDLRNLERLRIAHNQLTHAGVQALQATGVHVEAEDQFNEQQIGDHYHLFEGDPE